MSIAEAQNNFGNDNYDYNPEAQEQKGPSEILLMPGVYKVSAQIMERTRDDEPVISKDEDGNEWPVYVIPSFEVVEPYDEGGRFTVWQEVRTRPSRFSTDEPYTSEGAILLASIDREAARAAGSFGGAATALKEMIQGGPVTFRISTGLTARDSVWAKAQIEKLGPDPDKKEVQKIWRKANLKTSAFMTQKGSKGVPAKYATSCVSPLSGTRLDAKVKISRYLASDLEGVELGAGKFPPK